MKLVEYDGPEQSDSNEMPFSMPSASDRMIGTDKVSEGLLAELRLK
jgi:hypothetical protein